MQPFGHGKLLVDGELDRDGELEISMDDGVTALYIWLPRDKVVALRNHLTALLEKD